MEIENIIPHSLKDRLYLYAGISLTLTGIVLAIAFSQIGSLQASSDFLAKYHSLPIGISILGAGLTLAKMPLFRNFIDKFFNQLEKTGSDLVFDVQQKIAAHEQIGRETREETDRSSAVKHMLMVEPSSSASRRGSVVHSAIPLEEQELPFTPPRSASRESVAAAPSEDLTPQDEDCLKLKTFILSLRRTPDEIPFKRKALEEEQETLKEEIARLEHSTRLSRLPNQERLKALYETFLRNTVLLYLMDLPRDRFAKETEQGLLFDISQELKLFSMRLGALEINGLTIRPNPRKKGDEIKWIEREIKDKNTIKESTPWAKPTGFANVLEFFGIKESTTEISEEHALALITMYGKIHDSTLYLLTGGLSDRRPSLTKSRST